MKFFGSEVNRIMVIQEQFGEPKKNMVKLEDRLNEIEKERWIHNTPSQVFYNNQLSNTTKQKLTDLISECKKVRLKYNLGSN